MYTSLYSREVQAVLSAAESSAGTAAGPFPSPADWRDQIIYFFGFQAILEARHVRTAFQNRSGQQFQLVRTSFLKHSSQIRSDNRRRSKFEFSRQMTERTTLPE